MNRQGGCSHGRSSSFLLIVLIVLAAAADIAAAQDGPPSGRGPSYFNPQNFNPSMAVIIVALVTAFFFLGFFSIYIRRCAGPPLGEHQAGSRPGGISMFLSTATGGAARSRRARGLDPASLEAFPTMAYADVKAHRVAGGGKGELECAVCISEFEDDDTLRLLTKCSHAFHADCIDAWLASHVTCPVCRANLLLAGDADADAVAPAAADGASAAASTTLEQQGFLAAATAAPQGTTPTAPPEQVAVAIFADDAEEETEEERIRREEAAEMARIGSVKRALRSKSGRAPPARFPRSHTTGHSLALAPPAIDSSERYTLRLPEHVLQEIVAAGKLRRTRSLTAFREGRGFGGGRPAGRSVRLGQSGRWPNMSSFLPRSLTFSAWASTRRGGEADALAGGKGSKVAAGDGKAAAEQQRQGGACPLGPPGIGLV